MAKKKNNPLFLLLLCIFPLVLMAGGLFFCMKSPGFSVEKITSQLEFNENWEMQLTEEETLQEFLVEKIFPQTFTLIASGNQCYAFESKDKQYVLKFFKMQHLIPKRWLDYFPFSLLQYFGLKNENMHFVERIFTSYKQAFQFLKEETGLIYLHFNKTHHFKTDVSLIDKEGKKYTIDIDQYEFIVQKRATTIYEHLENLLEAKQNQLFRTCVRAFLQLIATQCEKGFVNASFNIRNNFGFIGKEAMQIDCAELTYDSSMKYPLNFRAEVLEMAKRLDEWVRLKYPDETLLIQDEAQKIINQMF